VATNPVQKAILIVLDQDVPNTEIAKVVSLVIETRNYTGHVEAIVVYPTPQPIPAIPPNTAVTIVGPGLKTA